ncbi:MAG: protein phosphatase CheZ [Gammaproteobacteria bacterium]|nr:MAG: protein phosphatase CheZ [Gammaproteobacteria bacterium]
MLEKNRKHYLSEAQRLIQCIEDGDISSADQIIDSMTKLRESELFKELGTLTRDLHDTIKNFGVSDMDIDLKELTEVQIPDATERINYVIETTEKAANRTLEAVEQGLPLAIDISDRANYLQDRWEKFKSRDLTVDQFRELSQELESYLLDTVSNGEALREKMNEALMAQEFQDITGQILRKVIEMVQHVEESLVYLVKMSAGATDLERPKRPVSLSAKTSKSDDELDGPVVPGTSTANNVVNGQDEVDDLLSSLGF